MQRRNWPGLVLAAAGLACGLSACGTNDAQQTAAVESADVAEIAEVAEVAEAEDVAEGSNVVETTGVAELTESVDVAEAAEIAESTPVATAPEPREPSAEERLAEALAAHDVLKAELKTATSEYRAAMRARYQKQQAGEEVGDAPASGVPAVLEKCMAKASEYAGQEGAVPFLVTVLQTAARSGTDDAKAALDTIVAQHAESPRLEALTYTFLYYRRQLGAEKVDAGVNKIIEVTPHRAVKCAMYFFRGSAVNRDRSSTPEQRETAVADLRKAAELAPETGYGKRAKSTIFELENLQIGMSAPDIEGNDLDGVAFKLSDYRGKVVVLDFWGDW